MSSIQEDGGLRQFTVSELTGLIKVQLEARFPRLMVLGEISNLRRQQSGHIYFTLKDSEAVLSSVMFRSQARLLPEIPKDGDQVLVSGGLNLYEPRGNYQLVVTALKPAGSGRLHQEFEKLKAHYQSRGFFDASHKKKIPFLPKKIGLVTSPSGAALRDILDTLNRRFSCGIEQWLYPAQVQGSLASRAVALGIRSLAEKGVDVIIVARGGGSLEDLWAFNEEETVQAVFECPVPVISGVGHETDFTLCDFVADLRAATPTAAAELAVPQSRDLIKSVKGAMHAIGSRYRASLVFRRRELSRSSGISLLQRLRYFYQKRSQDLDLRQERLILMRRMYLESFWQRLRQVSSDKMLLCGRRLSDEGGRRFQRARLRFLREWRGITQKKRLDFQQKMQEILAMDPMAPLRRGYAIVKHRDRVLMNLSELQQGDEIRLLGHGVNVKARVLALDMENVDEG